MLFCEPTAAKQLGKLSLKLCHKAKFHSVLLYHLNDFTGTQESPEPCAKASVKQKYSASKLFRAHSLFSCSFGPELASAQKLELLWYQTSLVEAPGHQSCGSDPVWFQQHKCDTSAASLSSSGFEYSWMKAITEETSLMHSATGGAPEEHSKGFQPEGSWAVTPWKSPWVSHGHL